MSGPTATATPPMSNPALASTPPPPQHTSTNPDTPDTVKKRSLSDVGSGSPRTEGGVKLSVDHGTENAVSVGTSVAGPAKKRTKLTEAEKEAREKEKLEREKEKASREKERLARVCPIPYFTPGGYWLMVNCYRKLNGMRRSVLRMRKRRKKMMKWLRKRR